MKSLLNGRTLIVAGAAVLFAAWANVSNAEFIDNGTFDTNLDGWSTGGDISTTWIDGTAHVGRPGTPGISIFSQTFTIDPSTTTGLSYSFEYMWQVIKPSVTDTFTAYIEYDLDIGGTSQINLLVQGSNEVPGADFDNTTFTVAGSAALSGLAGTTDNARIVFSLDENNSPRGTRIQLDNVSVAVPLPAAAWLFGSALLGLIGLGRRRKA